MTTSPRVTRSPMWIATLITLSVLVLAAGGLFGYQIVNTMKDTSPKITIATPDGPTGITTFTLDRASFTTNEHGAATFRLENKNIQRQDVALTTLYGTPDISATFTASVTTTGTETTSASLQNLKLSPVSIPANSTVPVRLELGTSSQSFNDFWQDHNEVEISVATLNPTGDN